MAISTIERLEKARKTQEKAREKALARQQDPAYIAKQREKQAAARIRAYERAKVRLAEKRSQPPKKTIPKAPITSRGMKGRTPSAIERRHMDRVGALPCIACLLFGVTTYPISLHHTAGRVDADAHMKVLPLCDHHHQHAAPAEVRAMYPWLIPIHADMAIGGKSAFSAAVASEQHLLSVVDLYLASGTLL
ncbi:Ref family recombination enhancement nuclease [Edwardsiella tarda]|uniref:Ref family recombination enhancement nuclease n=2 Tax=Edwardsiella tarda TaxID=636 RepID=UPI0005511BDB